MGKLIDVTSTAPSARNRKLFDMLISFTPEKVGMKEVHHADRMRNRDKPEDAGVDCPSGVGGPLHYRRRRGPVRT